MSFADSDDPREWIAHGETHLAHADSPMAGSIAVECFYAQQAAEMAVKAVYAARKIPHPRIHDIGELLNGLLRRGVSVPESLLAAGDLTDYALETRYAGIGPPPISEKDHREAVRLAGAVLEWAKKEVARKGGGE